MKKYNNKFRFIQYLQKRDKKQYPKSSFSPEEYRLQEEFEREFDKKDPIDPDEDAIDKRARRIA